MRKQLRDGGLTNPLANVVYPRLLHIKMQRDG
jgi:hypothetical protein